MTPAYQIIAEGENITALIADRLLKLEIVDQAGVKSDRLTLTIDDRDQRLEYPKTGAEIEVSLGYLGQALVKMGVYVVDEVEVAGPPREMTIRARAANMTKAFKSPRERSFQEVEFGDVIDTVAGEHGLEPVVEEELRKRFYEHVDQAESDMQMLTRMCSENDAVMKIADGRLVISKHASGKTATGRELPKGVIDASQCDSWSATLADRSEYKSVTAYWYDLKLAERVPLTEGSGSPSLTLKHSYSTEEEATNAAKSKLKSMTRGKSKANIKGMIGDPYLSAEQFIELTGFRSGVDGGDWVVTDVKHNFDDSGYRCDVELEAKG